MSQWCTTTDPAAHARIRPLPPRLPATVDTLDIPGKPEVVPERPRDATVDLFADLFDTQKRETD